MRASPAARRASWAAAGRCWCARGGKGRPGVGHHAPPASWPAGLRPTSSCTCPCAPSNVRLGCLSHDVAHGLVGDVRAAVSHTSERLQSRLQSRPLQPSQVALPAAVPQGTPEALPYPILRRVSRPRGDALRRAPGRAGGLPRRAGCTARAVGGARRRVLPRGRRKMPFDNHLEGSSIKRYSQVVHRR
jgi:hypothetical protein